MQESNDQLSPSPRFTQSGIILDGIGDGGSGSVDNPYYENDRYGRILSRTTVGTSGTDFYMLRINIDPRNLIRDDIIVEYRYFTKSHTWGSEANVKLPYFEFTAYFYDAAGNYAVKITDSKAQDSTAGFTKSNGLKDTYGAIVVVNYNTGSNSNNIYFTFGNRVGLGIDIPA